MSLHHDVVLVTLLEAHNEEVAVSQRRYEQVPFLSGYAHTIKWQMRFIGIATSLQDVVPDLHGLIIGASHELCVTNLR